MPISKESTILIVDDSPDVLKTLQELIEEYVSPKCKVWVAINAATALKIVGKKIPDLIITDWEMPNMDGIELIKKLRENTATAHTPIIMSTGVMTSSENLRTALNAGATDYVRKPIDPIELTARVQSMLRLSKSFQEIKELNNTKDRLFSIIAHDLKAPFNAISSLMLLPDEVSLTDFQIKDVLANVQNRLHGANNILNNLLHWAKSQMDGIEPSIQPFSFKSILIVELELIQPNAESKNVVIESTVTDEVHLLGDPNMIELVIRNLVSNAVKFSFSKGVVSISAEEQPAFWKISVADNGTGIHADTRAKLFGGQHVTNEGTSAEKGTGLGLMLCKDFVELNGGKLGVESQWGKGSTFWFTIPKA